MKGILLVFLSFFAAVSVDLGTVRQQFGEAKDSKAATEKLYASLSTYSKDDPVLLAYKGASYTLKARYVAAKAEKRQMVSQGIQLIEQAVKAALKQLEIRLVRLAVQENSPKILKYKTNITEDKQALFSDIKAQPAAVQSLIKRYAKQSTLFTADEQKKLGL
mgnify:CR=1 FL=1